MADAAKNTVTVQIGGEEYTIRTEAAPEYTLECAALVDRTIEDLLGQGPLIEAHKVAILAALSLADQLLRTRNESAETRERQAGMAARLAADLEAALSSPDLASAD
ncbi:MAG: cell division protein ZapA [Longimicrobiales bacterium]